MWTTILFQKCIFMDISLIFASFSDFHHTNKTSKNPSNEPIWGGDITEDRNLWWGHTSHVVSSFSGESPGSREEKTLTEINRFIRAQSDVEPSCRVCGTNNLSFTRRGRTLRAERAFKSHFSTRKFKINSWDTKIYLHFPASEKLLNERVREVKSE